MTKEQALVLSRERQEVLVDGELTLGCRQHQGGFGLSKEACCAPFFEASLDPYMLMRW